MPKKGSDQPEPTIHSSQNPQNYWGSKEVTACFVKLHSISQINKAPADSLSFPNSAAGEHQGVHSLSGAAAECKRAQVQWWNNIKIMTLQHAIYLRLKATLMEYNYFFFQTVFQYSYKH